MPSILIPLALLALEIGAEVITLQPLLAHLIDLTVAICTCKHLVGGRYCGNTPTLEQPVEYIQRTCMYEDDIESMSEGATARFGNMES